MRFLNAGRHAYAAGGVPCGPTICGVWGGVGGCDGGVCLLECGAGAVARLPRAANRRGCGHCELSRCGVCRTRVLCSRGRARAAQTVAERRR